MQPHGHFAGIPSCPGDVEFDGIVNMKISCCITDMLSLTREERDVA
jgi:hypothetical protein